MVDLRSTGLAGAEEHGSEREGFLCSAASDFYRGQLVEVMTHADDRKHFGFNVRLGDPDARLSGFGF